MADLIPVSNLTSVSTKPQQVVLAVYKEWQTHQNLSTAEGFTLSVPHISHLEGVWKLGAKYSRYTYTDTATKIFDSGFHIDYTTSRHGPILLDSIGWAVFQIVGRLDFGGDHGLYVGQIEQVSFNPKYLNPDGTPHGDVRPMMQVAGNLFTTTADMRSIPYHRAGTT
jgi:flavin reductase (DIM6/NTAB) family NADH-FMN oxidoreductase RutF